MGVSIILGIGFKSLTWYMIAYLSGLVAIHYYESLRVKDGFYENVFFSGLEAIDYGQIQGYRFEKNRLHMNYHSKFLFFNLKDEYMAVIHEEDKPRVEAIIREKLETA